jgi:H+/Cl- antiporter ClcA
MALVGNYTYFGTTSAMLENGVGWLAVPVCGVVGGLLGGVFSRILIMVAGGLPGPPGRWIKRWPVPFAMSCGLAVALCGIASEGTTFGTGYQQIKSVLDQGASLPRNFGGLKHVATTLTSISGIPGGIFSPSLAIGGGIGLNLGTLFSSVPVGVMVLLGMVAYFAGVVQAPITAFVIVTEMTDNHAMMVPLMATALIAANASRLICPEGVYHALAKNFVGRPASRSDLPPG